MLDHVRKLASVSHYSAPSDRPVTPVRIAPGHELIEIITGGEVYFELDGEERVFRCGTIFWHREGEWTVHRTPPENPYRCAAVRFEVTSSKRPGARVSCWSSPDEAVAFAQSAIRAFHSEAIDSGLLGAYIYSTVAFQAVSGRGGGGEKPPAALERAAAYLARHYSGNPTVEELAAGCGVSRAHLFALFRRYFNSSPYRYLLNIRLGQAKIKLSGSLRPIKEIALECGFDSLEVFYRRFRAGTGLTPGEYRRKYSLYSPQ